MDEGGAAGQGAQGVSGMAVGAARVEVGSAYRTTKENAGRRLRAVDVSVDFSQGGKVFPKATDARRAEQLYRAD